MKMTVAALKYVRNATAISARMAVRPGAPTRLPMKLLINMP
jgi:hypothetical protein